MAAAAPSNLELNAPQQASTSLPAPSDPQREGCLKVLLAALAGAVASFCWLALPTGDAPIIGPGLLPGAHPATVEFVRWAGLGAIAALVAGCIAPRWRWLLVPPLLVLLEIGSFIFVFLGVGAGDVPPLPGTRPGLLAGVAFGLLMLPFCRPATRPLWRGAAIVLALAALFSVLLISAWRGRADLAAMRGSVLPKVEALLRADVLTTTSPIHWLQVRRMMRSQGSLLESRGYLYLAAYGEMRQPKAEIYLERRSPQPAAPKTDQLAGFQADGLELQLSLPKDFDLLAESKERLAARLRQLTDLRPELRSRLVVLTRGGPNYYALATLHGITYELDWHTYKCYEFGRLGYIGPSIFITCRGVYSRQPPN